MVSRLQLATPCKTNKPCVWTKFLAAVTCVKIPSVQLTVIKKKARSSVQTGRARAHGKFVANIMRIKRVKNKEPMGPGTDNCT